MPGVNSNYNLPPIAPDKYIAANMKIPAAGRSIDLSQIPEKLISCGTTSKRKAVARKTIIFSVTLETKDAGTTRTPAKITIEIPFKGHYTLIYIEALDANKVKVKIMQGEKPKPPDELKVVTELTGDLTIDDKDGSIAVINKEKNKFIKVASKPNGDIEITNNCFDPGVKLTFEAEK